LRLQKTLPQINLNTYQQGRERSEHAADAGSSINDELIQIGPDDQVGTIKSPDY
jgi:hypothetical protein